MAIISDIPRKPSNITDFRCPQITVIEKEFEVGPSAFWFDKFRNWQTEIAYARTEFVFLISFKAAKAGPLRSTVVLGTIGALPGASLVW